MSEPTLFDAIPIETARTERDIALIRVAQAAPDEWKDHAWSWLVDYLEHHATFFPDDAWEAGLEAPPELRAWGPIVQRAAREGLIVKSGQFRQRTRGHATAAAVWRSMIYRESA